MAASPTTGGPMILNGSISINSYNSISATGGTTIKPGGMLGGSLQPSGSGLSVGTPAAGSTTTTSSGTSWFEDRARVRHELDTLHTQISWCGNPTLLSDLIDRYLLIVAQTHVATWGSTAPLPPNRVLSGVISAVTSSGLSLASGRTIGGSSISV